MLLNGIFDAKPLHGWRPLNPQQPKEFIEDRYASSGPVKQRPVEMAGVHVWIMGIAAEGPTEGTLAAGAVRRDGATSRLQKPCFEAGFGLEDYDSAASRAASLRVVPVLIGIDQDGNHIHSLANTRTEGQIKHASTTFAARIPVTDGMPLTTSCVQLPHVSNQTDLGLTLADNPHRAASPPCWTGISPAPAHQSLGTAP